MRIFEHPRLWVEGIQWAGHHEPVDPDADDDDFEYEWVPHTLRSHGLGAIREMTASGLFFAGHGSDEYGNCSYYLACPLFSVTVFPFPHFQREVKVPEPGEHPWIDQVVYHGWREDGD